MANTSGTSAFDLDLNDLFEEAFERCGKEMRSGYDFRTARRSFNLLTIEWANRGINLWTVEQGQILMNSYQAIYPLPVDTIDLLDQVVRTNNGSQTNQIDINISRISESTYSTIPNKNTNGRPIQVWINRQTGHIPTTISAVTVGSLSPTDTTITLLDASNLPISGFVNIGAETIGYQNIVGNQIINAWRGQNGTAAMPHDDGAEVKVNNLPCINVWPTPNPPGDQYTFVYWRLRRMQDAGSGTNVGDIPFRFIPALAAGLAYHIGAKLPDVDMNRVVALKTVYEEEFQRAADEDREKAPIRFVPRNLFYYR